MSPADLDEYLKVMVRNQVGLAAIKLSDGSEMHITFIPFVPSGGGSIIEPGGWKGMMHLDDPHALRDNHPDGDLP